MEFFQCAAGGVAGRAGSHVGRVARLGILPGTFNPVTVAHLALAQAGLSHVDEVVFVLPRAFPHKDYSGARFADRVGMLRAALAGYPSFSVAAADGGLFVEIAEECRAAYGDSVRLTFLCGRDAAERIVGWDYGRPDALARMLRRFDLLVAARNGEYTPPVEYRGAIGCLEVAGDFHHVSATEIRRRIAARQPWEHLVPGPIRELVRSLYGETSTGWRPPGNALRC